MKTAAYILLLFYIISCSTAADENIETDLTTIDSNTVKITDTAPSILYLDNAKLDTFPMAMDSAGATINADDTSYQKPGD